MEINPAFTYIYALIDPDTNQVRYIGKSNNPHKRYIAHISDNRKNYKSSWIKSLLNNKQKPILKELVRIPLDKWEFVEREMIKHYKQFSKLTNLESGGLSNKVHAVSTIKKISDAKKGLKCGEKNPFYGKKHSEEFKIRLSKLQKEKYANGYVNPCLGKELTKGHRNKIGSANNGKNSRVKKHSATSQYFGVCWDKRAKQWFSHISYNKKALFIGRFDSEVEAALAYNKKAIELRGGGTRINIINSAA